MHAQNSLKIFFLKNQKKKRKKGEKRTRKSMQTAKKRKKKKKRRKKKQKKEEKLRQMQAQLEKNDWQGLLKVQNGIHLADGLSVTRCAK